MCLPGDIVSGCPQNDFAGASVFAQQGVRRLRFPDGENRTDRRADLSGGHPAPYLLHQGVQDGRYVFFAAWNAECCR